MENQKPPSELVTLKIDGKTVSVPKGTNLLEAAKSVDIPISYFCYHPGLSSPAVCRQCLVDVKGQPKLVPSCYTPVAENMEVSTTSERTLQARQQMLEFTLVNHPVDCPICDKAGECTLQKLYVEWDGKESRVDYNKVHKPKRVDLGPEIVLDAERCILCTRCIRVCDEVAHDHQLEMAWRGDHEQITVAPGTQLDNPYSLNTVDVCPVGALTSKDFRFAMRAWELTATPSVCTGCATGCNDEIHHAQGKIYRLIPRENQAVNRFWMCDEGRFTYKEINQQRLVGAAMKQTPTKRAVALNEIVEKIRTADWSKAGIVVSAQWTNEDTWLLVKVARELGFTKFYAVGRPKQPERADKILRHEDVNPNWAGVKAIAKGLGITLADGAALERDLKAGSLQMVWAASGGGEYPEATLAALDGVGFLIVQSPYADALSAKAQVALPVAAWAELDGTWTNHQGLVQRGHQAFQAPGEALAPRDWIQEITTLLGHNVRYANLRMLFADMKKSVGDFSQAELGREIRPIQLRFAGSRG